MKPLMLIRGAALSGALTLTYAATAFAAPTPHAHHHAAAANATTATTTTTAAKTATTAYNSVENTPLNLGGSGTAHAATGSGSGLLRTIVGLFIVIIVIWGIAWILRRVKGGGTKASGNGLGHIATLPLGNGRSVALVRAGQEFVLVGISEHAVTPIRTYTEAEAIEAGFDVRGEDGTPFDQPDTPLDRVVDALRRMTVRS
jgi:flagellar protein FliO/FliZ